MRVVPYQVQCYLLTSSSINTLRNFRTTHKLSYRGHPLNSSVQAPWLRLQCREAKSKATVKVQDLPQGLLEDSPKGLEREDEGPLYPTVIQQARNNMRKFEHCVVLTRMGGFYEVYQK